MLGSIQLLLLGWEEGEKAVKEVGRPVEAVPVVAEQGDCTAGTCAVAAREAAAWGVVAAPSVAGTEIRVGRMCLAVSGVPSVVAAGAAASEGVVAEGRPG